MPKLPNRRGPESKDTGLVRNPSAVTRPAWCLNRGRWVYRVDATRVELNTGSRKPGLRSVWLAGSWLGARSTVLSVIGWQPAGGPLHRLAPHGVKARPRIRGAMVDIEWDAGPRLPTRTQCVWCVAAPDQIDMQLLASTARFDPLRGVELLTFTQLARGELLFYRSTPRGAKWTRVIERSGAAVANLVLCRDRDAKKRCRDGRFPHVQHGYTFETFASPVVVLRPAGADWSYVEMSTADDCWRILMGVRPTGMTLSFGLFGHDLENGVILRGRVRAMRVPRANDCELAEESYQRLESEPPPLTA